MSFPTSVQGSAGFDKAHTSAKKHRIGTKMVFPDGRVFWYHKSAEAITAGKITMGSQTASDHVVDLSVAAAVSAGASQITVTNGGSTAITGSGRYTDDFTTAGDYEDGYIFTNDSGSDASGEGQIWQIRDHSSAATGATITIDLYDNESVSTALTTNSQVGLHKPIGHSVEVWDLSDIDGPPLGTPTRDVTSGYYFWNQSAGPGMVLTQGTVLLGNEVYTGDTNDGVVEASADDNSGEVRIGVVLAAAATTEYSLVDLQIRY